jgi:hypothetical protein
MFPNLIETTAYDPIDSEHARGPGLNQILGHTRKANSEVRPKFLLAKIGVQTIPPKLSTPPLIQSLGRPPATRPTA